MFETKSEEPSATKDSGLIFEKQIKKSFKRFFVVCAGSLILGQNLFGATNRFLPAVKNVELDVNSRYVWRGIVSSDGAVFQPSFGLSYLGLDFSIWGNQILEEGVNQGKFDETTTSVWRDFSWRKATISPSFDYYSYFNQADVPDTAEASITVSYPIGPFVATTLQSVDIVHYDGAYYGEAGVSYEEDFAERISFIIHPYVGWADAKFNNAYFEVDKSALNVVGADVSISWTAGGKYYLTPYVNMSSLCDNELRNASDKPGLVIAGLKVGREF